MGAGVAVGRGVAQEGTGCGSAKSAACVSCPATPSTVRPLFFWKARTASRVWR